MYKKILIYCIAFLLPFAFAHANDPEQHAEGGKKFEAGKEIMHHILDSHEWHFFDMPQGNGKYSPVALDLPWILYSKENGLAFYTSTEILNESGIYHAAHNKVHALKTGEPATHETHTDVAVHGEPHEANIDENVKVYDFSMTKTSLQMLLVGIALLLVFTSVARGYSKNKGKAPSGIQSFMEPIVMFVRDMSKEYLGKNHERFLPYQLTVFFFIWFSNLLGLMPFNSNIMGNFTVTCMLAVISFFLINVNGTKDYWKHIIAMPGVPKWVLIILTPVELLGIFIKPVALAIRLFANISAGHFMVLALVSLIFILGKSGESIGGAVAGGVLGVAFSLFIFTLEMLVAILQAYIFTLLTTVFIGMSMASHDDHAHGHDEHHATPVQHSEVNKDLRMSDFGVS